MTLLLLLAVTLLYRDRIVKEEETRREEEAKSTHAQLLKALCDAAAADDKHVLSLKDAIACNDVSRAEVAVQALRASAEAMFTAGGGSSFGKVLPGLVQFMKKHERSVFGKQNRELWQGCCERLYDELLNSNNPAVVKKRAKAASVRGEAISRWTQANHARHNRELQARCWDMWHAFYTRCIRDDPIKFLNSFPHQRWYATLPLTNTPFFGIDCMRTTGTNLIRWSISPWRQFAVLLPESSKTCMQIFWRELRKQVCQGPMRRGAYKLLTSMSPITINGRKKNGCCF